jgi:hypothetical protein
VAKGLLACKRARPDIHPTIAVLVCTRVKKPNEDDWRKLNRLMKYLNGTREDKLILLADDLATRHQVVWQLCICGAPRLQEPHWWKYDIWTGNAHVHVKKTKIEYERWH